MKDKKRPSLGGRRASSRWSVASTVSTGTSRSKPKKQNTNKDVKYLNSELKAQGIKHGIREVSRAHFIDENGDIDEEAMQFAEDRQHFNNKYMQCFSKVLIFTKCLPADPEDMWAIKHWLLLAQWSALLCDIMGALVALFTFSDVTYCCGQPILDIAGSIPWKDVIQYMTYCYLALVFLEVYPVVRKGFPFNIVNPVIGFTITLAMFFDDSKTEALIMWGIESSAIICEFVLFRLKVRQIANQERELVEVGRKTKQIRAPIEGEDPDAPQRELRNMRRKYYQLKQDALQDNTLLWYLGVGCYLNIILSLIVLTFIIIVAQGGGLCIDEFNIPNPFDLDQLGRCSLCEGTSGVCEICTDEVEQCYYPYS